MKLQVKCEGNFLVDWQNLEDIQGDAKYLDGPEMEKLLNSFEENGFCDPICVWHNEENGQDICIAGNQRLKALHRAKELGWEIPDKLPANKVHADNMQSATKILLSLASTFGRINKKEVEELAKKVKIPILELEKITSFVEVDINKIKESLVKESFEINSRKEENISNYKNIMIPFSREEFPEVLSNLNLYNDHGGFNNISEAFKQLLKDGLEKIENQVC